MNHSFNVARRNVRRPSVIQIRFRTEVVSFQDAVLTSRALLWKMVYIIMQHPSCLSRVLRSRGWANHTRPVWGNAGLSFLRYLCSALLVWLRVSSAFFAVEMNPWSSCSCFQSVIGIIYNNMNIFHDGTESIMFLNVYLYWGSRTQFVGAIHIYIVSCVIRPFYSCVRLLYLWGGTEHTWW